MRDDTEQNDGEQPAPTTPSSMNTGRSPMPTRYRKVRARTTHSVPGATQSLAVLAASLSNIMAADVVKEVILLMRIIVQRGNRQRQFLAPRRQKVRDLIVGAKSLEVERIYSQFALSHNASEKRLTFKLPVLEGEREDEQEDRGEAMPAVDGDDLVVGDIDKAEEGDQFAKDHVPKTVEWSENHERSELLENDNAVTSADVQLSDQLQSITSEGATRATSPLPSPHLSTRPAPSIQTGVICDKHSGGVCTLVPIQNPEAFPLSRIQEIQADYYPLTRILAMWLHRDKDNQINQVTAHLDKGSVDHVLINDPRIITSLGLREPPYDSICLQSGDCVDETYKVRWLPKQARHNARAWITGELVSARHAYLFWLDFRQCSDPKGPPTAAEAKLIAVRTGRRAWDVKQEIDRYWTMEYGSGGRRVRENRKLHLGEDPRYGDFGRQKSAGRLWA